MLKTWIGVILGVCALALPFFVSVEGLSFPAAIGLGIFGIAAIFWISECVPIWATSLMVILLQIVLLSDQSPIMQDPVVPAQTLELSPASTGPGQMFQEILEQLPPSAVHNGSIWVKDGPKWIKTDASQFAERETPLERTSITVAQDAQFWALNYRPIAYTQFFNTLAHPILMLFLGGFFLAAAAVKYRLDINITRIILKAVGTRPSAIILGLLGITAFLSAFMSNTATAAMMMAVVIPLTSRLAPADKLRSAIVLAIPCGANIGGIATPIGSPPNAVALSALSKIGTTIPFSQWLLLMAPLAVIMVLVCWRALIKLFPTETQTLNIEIKGRWERTPKAIATYAVFAVTIGLWITDALHGIPAAIVAFVPVTFLSLFGIIERSDLKTFSWEVLWLVAGGISLGTTLQLGGADWLVSLVDWSIFGPMGIVALLALTAYTLSNLISNTVAATILIPIALTLGTGGIFGDAYNPDLAAIVIAITVSFAMLLPISTPPNAIALATDAAKSQDLIKIGAVVGTAGYVITLLFGMLIWTHFV